MEAFKQQNLHSADIYKMKFKNARLIAFVIRIHAGCCIS